MQTILKSEITCPNCGHKKVEEMPTNACQFFYECDNCQNGSQTKRRRLLCVLFLWNSSLSTNSRKQKLLLVRRKYEKKEIKFKRYKIKFKRAT